MSEANWKKEKAKLEKPGYTIIRQTNQSGKVGGILKEGQDGYASNWFEINKADLGAAGGGSYDDTALWQETSDLQDQIDALDTAVQALPSTYATKKELTDAVADLQAQIDAIDGSGGDPFDPSELEAALAQLQIDVEALQTALATETQERKDADDAIQAEVDQNKEDIEANTDAINVNKSAIEGLEKSKVSVAGGTETLTIWTGTEADYNLIGSKDDNTLYVITGGDAPAIEAPVIDTTTLDFHSYIPYETIRPGECIIEKTSDNPPRQYLQFFHSTETKDDSKNWVEVPEFKVGDSITIADPGFDASSHDGGAEVTFTIADIEVKDDGKGEYYVLHGEEEGVWLHEPLINQKIKISFHIRQGTA